MRLLRINGIEVDIDEQTAIGIDYQAYDIKNPSQRKINISNSFTIPTTSKNNSITGNAANPQSIDTTIYSINYCDYWVNNKQFIIHAKCQFQEINDRIAVFIYEKDNLWDQLKDVKWNDFLSDFLIWGNTKYNLPIQSDPYTGNVNTFITPYMSSSSGIFLPLFLGNMANYIATGVHQVEGLAMNGTIVNTHGLVSLINWSFTSATTGTKTNSFTIHDGDTMPEVAAAFIASLQADGDVSGYVDLNQDGVIVVATCKIASNQDPTFDFGYTVTNATGIVDNTGSVSFAVGYPAGVDYIEKMANTPTVYGRDAIIYLKYATYEDKVVGGHFCIYAKTIFEYIEDTYGVDFNTTGGVIPGNIWDDSIANKMFTPARELDVDINTVNCFFQLRPTGYSFNPLKDVSDKPDKTLFDFANAFFQHFNIIVDTIEISGNDYIALRRFDQIEDDSEIKNWTGLTGKVSFKPLIDGYAQNNTIKFKEVYPQGSPLLNSKVLTCQNKNIDVNKDLFTIDAYVPGIIPFRDYFVANMSDKESFKTFTFFIANELTTNDCDIVYLNIIPGEEMFKGYAGKMYIAELYQLDSEYVLLNQALQYPKYYEVKKWLRPSDIKELEFFKLYYFQELNGSFFLNKIAGFNPEKAKEPTTLELIRISDKTPTLPGEINPWVDGEANNFVDGDDNLFI